LLADALVGASGGATAGKATGDRVPARLKPVIWVTEVVGRRRHRATGERKGRKPNDDAMLTDVVHALMEQQGATSIAARRTIAAWLSWTEGISNFDAAMRRVRKGLR
jgi:hypothetical protein